MRILSTAIIAVALIVGISGCASEPELDGDYVACSAVDSLSSAINRDLSLYPSATSVASMEKILDSVGEHVTDLDGAALLADSESVSAAIGNFAGALRGYSTATRAFMADPVNASAHEKATVTVGLSENELYEVCGF